MKPTSYTYSQFCKGNVYDACNDTFVVDARINEHVIVESANHDIAFSNKQRKVTLDPLAPDYDDVFVDKGTPLAPDDILDAVKPLALKIPVKYRNEIENLPLAELLRAIHFHASHLEITECSLDETALLTLGMLVEQWAEELIDENVAKMFLEPEEAGVAEFGPSDSEEELSLSDAATQEDDSDIMSIDLEETDNEVVETEAGFGEDSEDSSDDSEVARVARKQVSDSVEKVSNSVEQVSDSVSDSVSESHSGSSSSSHSPKPAISDSHSLDPLGILLSDDDLEWLDANEN